MVKMRGLHLMPLLMILFWVTVIFGFLFLPTFFSRFSSQKSINIYSWTEVIDPRKVAEFQKETGIKVNIGYFESNEELYAKIKLTKGAGYDLIVPSDYMVETFIKEENFLQKIDKSKLPFWRRLNPLLLDHYYDPKNEYSIPYLWGIYGLAVNKKHFGPDVDKNWALLFNPLISKTPRVMLEDMRELMLVAAYYLFGTFEDLDEGELVDIKKVLLAQKEYVLAYAEVSAPYLLVSGQTSLALASSPYVLRIIKHNPDIDFFIPQENPVIAIDNLVIPASSNKQELVYQFIEFLFRPEVMTHHVQQTYFFPATTDVECQEVETSSKNLLASCAKKLKKVEFLRNVIPIKTVNNFLIALKS